MAGYDGDFSYDPRDEDLLRALAPLVARRARRMHVRWRFRLDKPGYAHFQLDGNGYQIDMLMERLSRDLPSAAEAVPTWRPPAARRRLAVGFVDILWRWRLSFYDRYTEAHVPRLRGKAKPVKGAIFDVFPDGKHADLWPRLSVTSEIMADWLMDEAPAEVVLEELHTAAELLLWRLWGRAKSASFAQLVEHADQKGALDSPLVWDYDEAHRAEALGMGPLLLQLKDWRKRAKHRGAADAEEWLRVHFWPAARTIERLSWVVSSR